MGRPGATHEGEYPRCRPPQHRAGRSPWAPVRRRGWAPITSLARMALPSQDVLETSRCVGARPPSAAYRHRMMTSDTAEAVARELLAESLPRRWAHTQGVAAKAAQLSPITGPDADLLIAAAWLHDLGYAPALAQAGTGFHPLAGARYLRDIEHADPDLCRLVAHHSCALAGATQLGLADTLAREFAPPSDDLADALTFCDMTTSPDGHSTSVEHRLAEICARYGPADPVTRAITASAPNLTAAVDRVTKRLTTAGSAGAATHELNRMA